MNPDDEPAMKRTADAASNACQKLFLRLSRGQLGMLSATAVVSGWNPSNEDLQRNVAILVFVLMMFALALGIALKIGTFDDKWFRCRALAENFKSVMWYFIMSPANERDVRRHRYNEQLQEVEERLPGLHKTLAVHRVAGTDFTPWMERIHTLPAREKLAFFRKERLQDQLNWYDLKARLNAKRESQWQWAVFALEFVAVVYAALQTSRLWEFNAVGGIAAVSAALVAWTQTKRHSDLANSYAVAATDLRRIDAAWQGDLSQQEVDHFVHEVETAVSREHSLWLSKRVA